MAMLKNNRKLEIGYFSICETSNKKKNFKTRQISKRKLKSIKDNIKINIQILYTIINNIIL